MSERIQQLLVLAIFAAVGIGAWAWRQTHDDTFVPRLCADGSCTEEDEPAWCRDVGWDCREWFRAGVVDADNWAALYLRKDVSPLTAESLCWDVLGVSDYDGIVVMDRNEEPVAYCPTMGVGDE